MNWQFDPFVTSPMTQIISHVIVNLELTPSQRELIENNIGKIYNIAYHTEHTSIPHTHLLIKHKLDITHNFSRVFRQALGIHRNNVSFVYRRIRVKSLAHLINTIIYLKDNAYIIMDLLKQTIAKGLLSRHEGENKEQINRKYKHLSESYNILSLCDHDIHIRIRIDDDGIVDCTNWSVCIPLHVIDKCTNDQCKIYKLFTSILPNKVVLSNLDF